MATTFLELTNKLLRRLNEAEITSAEFASVRNIQAAAKDFIADTIDEINTNETEWPFNFQPGSQVCTVGQEIYDFPADANTVNWNSFFVLKDDALNIRTTPLVFIKRDDWYKKFRQQDDDAGTQGLEAPRYVFQATDQRFGVSRSPDAAYTITFDYYKTPERLVAYNDVSTFPSQYDFVIIDGALRHFYAHKDNSEQWDRQEVRFNKVLASMKNTLINRQDYVTDTRTNFGGIERVGFHD